MGLFKKKKKEENYTSADVITMSNTITISTKPEESKKPDLRLDGECYFFRTFANNLPYFWKSVVDFPKEELVWASDDNKTFARKFVSKPAAADYNALAVKGKEPVTKVTETYLITYTWDDKEECYVETASSLVAKDTEVITPEQGFANGGANEGFILTEEEFQRYMKSGVTLNDWKNIKLYKRLHQFGIDDEFIKQYGKCINTKEKYERLLMIIKECDFNPDAIKYAITEGFSNSGLCVASMPTSACITSGGII